MDTKIKEDVLDEIKRDRMNEISWISKKTARGIRSDMDISLRLIKNGGGKKNTINLILRNGISEIFEAPGLVVGVRKNRMFFVPREDGYKIGAANDKSDNRYVRIPATNNDLIEFCGDYELKYDNFLEMYYIEREDA